jgi:hypothetical protein
MKVILTESQIKRVLEQKNDLITSLKQMGFVPSGNGVFKHSQKPELTVTLAGDIVIVKNNGQKIAEIKTSDIEDLEGTIKSTSLKEQTNPAEKEKVRKIQNKLISLGYNLGKTGADGFWGTLTDKAWKDYKSKKPASKTSATPINKDKISLTPKTPAYRLNNFDSNRIQKDTFDPYAQQTANQLKAGEFRAQQFSKGIVPVKKDSGIKPQYRIFSDFLSLRKNPITTNDFTTEELKTILGMIKKSKVGKEPKNVDFTSGVNWSKIKSGEESQLNPDMEKSIGYTLGNAQVQDMGTYYKVTDIYDFNNYQKHPEKYTLKQLPNTIGTAVNKLFSGNLVQGVEELASYYQKLGYKGIPVSLDIPKNLA